MWKGPGTLHKHHTHTVFEFLDQLLENYILIQSQSPLLEITTIFSHSCGLSGSPSQQLSGWLSHTRLSVCLSNRRRAELTRDIISYMSDPTIPAACHAGAISVFKVVQNLIMSQRIVLLQLSKLKPDLWLKFASSICFSSFFPQRGICVSAVPSICKLYSQTTPQLSADQAMGERGDGRWPSSPYFTNINVPLCSLRGSLMANRLLLQIFNIIKTVYLNVKTSQANKQIPNFFKKDLKISYK